MIRPWLSIVSAAAVGAAAVPALAQDGPPPGWDDPQAPEYPAPRVLPVGPPGTVQRVMPAGPAYPRMPMGHPMPPGARPMPMPHPDGAMPGAMPWREGPMGGYGYEYGYQAGPAAAAPCGCPGYPPPVMWMRVPVETRYHYSRPVRHVEEIVETRVVRERVVETKTVPVRTTKYVHTKYVKSAPVKETKTKVVRTTK